jgi:hypothetical protein
VIACSETVEHPFALVHDRQEATVVGVILVWSAVSPRKSAGRSAYGQAAYGGEPPSGRVRTRGVVVRLT